MKIAIGSDHAAIDERLALIEHLKSNGHEVNDFGCPPGGAVDYPDVAAEVARSVATGDAERGFILCGTGIGVCMAANKVNGIRAATLHNEFTAEMTRRHNDANVACMGARTYSATAMQRMADLFLETPFDGGRHEGRVAKIMAIEDATVRS